MKRIFIFFLCFILLSGCQKKQPVNGVALSVDGQIAFELTAKISAIAPRGNGAVNTQKAVNFIKNTILKTGTSVKTDTWTTLTPIGEITFTNIIAEIKGISDKFIVIGSHYDTKRLEDTPDFKGANDSGSSSGLLLAMIERIKKARIKPPYTLKFVFFDGEECFLKYSDKDGLYGSRRYVQRLTKQNKIKKCLYAVILDMIGDKDLQITLPLMSDKILAQKIFKIAEAQGTQEYFTWASVDIIDDHTPFLKAGIPAIDIIDFKYGPNNMYWHTAEDTMDKLASESFRIVGNCVLKLITEKSDY